MTINPRSKDFRYIYVNGMAIQFNGQEMQIRLGIKEDLGDTGTQILEEAALIMSASTAKYLGIVIGKIVAAAEKEAGQPIPVEQDKLDIVEQAISNAKPPS